jgi:hypothetical protein
MASRTTYERYLTRYNPPGSCGEGAPNGLLVSDSYALRAAPSPFRVAPCDGMARAFVKRQRNDETAAKKRTRTRVKRSDARRPAPKSGSRCCEDRAKKLDEERWGGQLFVTHEGPRTDRFENPERKLAGGRRRFRYRRARAPYWLGCGGPLTRTTTSRIGPRTQRGPGAFSILVPRRTYTHPPLRFRLHPLPGEFTWPHRAPTRTSRPKRA